MPPRLFFHPEHFRGVQSVITFGRTLRPPRSRSVCNARLSVPLQWLFAGATLGLAGLLLLLG